MITELSLQRKFELSICKFIRDLVADSVRVIDDDVENDLVVPTVACVRGPRYKYQLEHGALERDKTNWSIIIYARTRTERDVLDNAIFNVINCNIPVYAYTYSDSGLPTVGNKIGTLIVKEPIVSEPVRVPNEISEQLRYRALITFHTVYQEN
jgi:hypothetical protein